MTLFKQILIIMTFFQILVLSAVMWQNFDSANEFIQDQLYTDAKHTAISLGLSIKSVGNTEDLATMETMINSIFDSGYYEMIRLIDVDGKELVKSYQPTTVKNVPKWFINLVPLKSPLAESEIIMGWSLFGKLQVQSNSGIAYLQLWEIFQKVSFWFIIISIVAFIALYSSLNVILKPLIKVKKQAEAILESDFIIQDKIPFTIELKKMVFAMNSMVGKVKEIFEKEANAVRQNYNLLYRDETTSLYNRRFFVNELDTYVKDEESSTGSIALMSFNNYGQLKEQIGYQKAQNLLIKIVEKINQTIKGKSVIIARMSESDFVFFLPDANLQILEKMCENLMDILEKILNLNDVSPEDFSFNCGVSNFNDSMNVKTILSKVDLALSMAKNKGKFKVEINRQENDEVVLGKDAWRDKINLAIEENKFIFALQKIETNNKALEHYEIFLRLEEKERIQNAGYFMPMVNELGKNIKIDKYVLSKFINLLKDGILPKSSYAINLSYDTLTRLEDLSWFEESLEQISKLTNLALYFELTYKKDLPKENLSILSKILRQKSFGLGLDNFDIEAVDSLQEINPTYLKIPYSKIIDLHSKDFSEHSKQSFDIITKSMNIEIIVTGIENKQEKQNLQEMGLTSMQGRFIQQPYILRKT